MSLYDKKYFFFFTHDIPAEIKNKIKMLKDLFNA